MEYRQLGWAGIKVSRACLGTMMFGGQTTPEDSSRIIHKALDLGINFIDTADMYVNGQSEVVVGQALAGKRDQVILATKGRQAMGSGINDVGASRRHMIQACEASLKRLGTDYIDLYYVHTPDDATTFDETLRALDDLVRAGKVHYIACSNFRAWRIAEALWTSDVRNLHRFCALQPLYNIVNRDIEVEVLPLCRDKKLGVVSYSPLARGILTGKYKAGTPFPEGSRAARNDKRMQQAELRDASFDVAAQLEEYCRRKNVALSQFSIAWVLANPNLTSVILGPRTMEQFDDNFGAINVTITPEDEQFVDSLIPPGEHSGKGFQDTQYPITGRQ